jgi:hypothetical protein
MTGVSTLKGGDEMTWNSALVFTFGPAVPGREAAALANFAHAQGFFSQLAADGKCEAETYLWGYGGGMMIVKGESPEALGEILGMDESRKMLSTGSLTSQAFSYQMAATGEMLANAMTNYAAVSTELGYL